jgi:hypothetical protein
MRSFSPPLLLTLVAISATQFLSAQEPKSDPRLDLWRTVKALLQKADEEATFESIVKGVLLPGETDGVKRLRGTVLSTRPAEAPSEIVLAISDTTTPEVTLKFVDDDGKADHSNAAITPGTRVAFAGVVTEFTRDPFMLIIETQAGDAGGVGFAVVVEAPEESSPMPSVSVSSSESWLDQFQG